MINGFWIEETGIIDVTIEYELQRWFYMGSTISVTAFIASILYLTRTYTHENGITLKTIRNKIRKTRQTIISRKTNIDDM